jgi:hypothetical protein
MSGVEALIAPSVEAREGTFPKFEFRGAAWKDTRDCKLIPGRKRLAGQRSHRETFQWRHWRVEARTAGIKARHHE